MIDIVAEHLAAFWAKWRRTCTCVGEDLRNEGRAVVCAGLTCGKPIVRRG